MYVLHNKKIPLSLLLSLPGAPVWFPDHQYGAGTAKEGFGGANLATNTQLCSSHLCRPTYTLQFTEAKQAGLASVKFNVNASLFLDYVLHPLDPPLLCPCIMPSLGMGMRVCLGYKGSVEYSSILSQVCQTISVMLI